MTAPTFAGAPRAGTPLPPHQRGVTRDALDALARTTTKVRRAFASRLDAADLDQQGE